MRKLTIKTLGALLFAAATAVSPAWAKEERRPAHAHDHGRAHGHERPQDEATKKIYDGYFADEQVRDRALSDWAGAWRSVYPYLKDGSLDVVMAKKAKFGDKTAEQYKAYYEKGYATDVDRIDVKRDVVTFHRAGEALSATYAQDGHEILTYAKGNRGVRYVFKKTAGDPAAPTYIQFSDHKIAPQKADHYHLYWGDDRAALLKEVEHWPTYYPNALTKRQIVQEMLAH
jgi:zinc transport system substrate-binding protein